MARWRLTQKHYLNTPDAFYEYRETTPTGKQLKKKFACGLHVDPENPTDVRDYGQSGEIIVAHAGGDNDKDLVFSGPPTLDMVPLDDEAKALSAEMAGVWGKQFLDEDNEGGMTSKLLLELTDTLSAFNASAQPSTPAPKEPDPDIAALKDMVKSLVELQTAQIAKNERRV